MAVRRPLTGPVSRKPVLLYDEDIATIQAKYKVLGLSAFVRELVNRHCKELRSKAEAQLQRTHPELKDDGVTVTPNQVRNLG